MKELKGRANCVGCDYINYEADSENTDGHTRKGSTTSVQKAVFSKLVLETDVEKTKRDQIGVEERKIKAGHGKGGSTWQWRCATLTPLMLGHEIEEELVAENQAATLPTVTLNGRTGWLGVYADDEGTGDRDDIVNDSGTKGTTLTKGQGELLEHDKKVVGKSMVDNGGSNKNERSKEKQR
ncbi:hypothetical protein AHAS_Ahas05G0263500 [Arachis hypogaea]